MFPDRNLRRRRTRRWDRVSWWYSLVLVIPLIGLIATALWSSGGEPSGLSGVVRDAYTGKPVSGAIVSTANATATTNGDGAFNVDDELATTLNISREDYAATQVVITGVDQRLEVDLRPTRIEGTVRNKRTDKPIPNVTVTATGPNGETVTAVTDERGRYVLDNVPEGAEISVMYEGFTVVSKPLGKNVKLDFEIRPDVLTGRVTDLSGRPLEGAVVSVGAATATTGPDGTYRIAAVPDSGTIIVKKAGYIDFSGALPDSLKFDAQLTEFTVKAIYVSVATAADDSAWAAMMAIADQTEVNAIVLDIKDGTGQVAYDSTVPMTIEVGSRTAAYSLQPRLQDLKNRGLYAIARIVVFEDPLLAQQRPALAIQDATYGGLWTTWDGRAWVNPYDRQVWKYNIDIAVEVAKAGFDEVQFDVVRFPTDGILDDADYGSAGANQTMLDATTGFLDAAQKALRSIGVYVGVTIEGLSAASADDRGIGESLTAFAPLVDVVSPMLFPSHFYPGQFGFDIPNDHPYDVVLTLLQISADQIPDARDKLRPWLQDFSFGEGIAYGDAEVRAQTDATERFDTHGWMLWSPKNQYHVGALNPE